MPSGAHLSADNLQQIWFSRTILQQDHLTIFENIFRNGATFISLKYLRKLCLRCDSGEYDNQFLDDKLPRSGGPERIINALDTNVFVNIFTERPQTTSKRAREVMCEEHYDAVYGVPSIRSFGRVLKRRKITRKVMERMHYLRCPNKRVFSWTLLHHSKHLDFLT